MDIKITDRLIVLSNLTEIEKNKIVNKFSLKDERDAFGKGGFDVKKIKTVKFYAVYKNTLLLNVGLLYDLLSFVKLEEFNISLKDERTKLDYQNKEYSYDELRELFNPEFDYVEHQISALRRMLATNRGIIKAPTSSGKSNIFLAFCKLVNLKVLILVNKRDLARQIHDVLNEGGFPILYRDSTKRNKVRPEASYVSTVGVAGDLPNDFDVVIVDECHRSVSNTFQDFLSKSKAKAFYGFSATPEGNHVIDFMKVKKYLGNIIQEIEIQDLIDNEVIIYPTISLVENMVPSLPSKTDWPSVNSVCIVNNMDRNEKIKELVLKHDLPTLILVRHIEHGKYLEQIITDSLFVSGEDSSEKRKEAIDEFTEGELKVLIATNIFNEGISINAIRVLIVASGGKSEIETIQRLGRALRKDEGKKEAIVYDFYDIGNKITQRQSKQRMKIYEKVGFPVKILES